jgi:hypothetical protein
MPLAESGVRFDDEVLPEIVELSGGRPYYLQKLAYFAFDAAEEGRVGWAEFAAAFERAFASVSQEIRGALVGDGGRRAPGCIRRRLDDRGSHVRRDRSRSQRLGIAPPATRQALRRLAARGHIDRLANGQRGRYLVSDRLFMRYLELRGGDR